MPEYAYENLDVKVRRTADGEFVQYGVVVEGSWQPFHNQTAAALAEDIASAAADQASYDASTGHAPTE